MTYRQRNFLIEQAQEWLKAEKESEAQKDKNMIKGLAKVFKG